MDTIERQVARISQALTRKGFNEVVVMPNDDVLDIDGKLILIFPDGRPAFGSLDELMPIIEQASSLESLVKTLDEQELLTD
jgi:hypothetical protein